jgi:hypothetical protein
LAEALDEVYHLLRAAFPNNPNLKNIKHVLKAGKDADHTTGLSPSMVLLSRRLVPAADLP